MLSRRADSAASASPSRLAWKSLRHAKRQNEVVQRLWRRQTQVCMHSGLCAPLLAVKLLLRHFPGPLDPLRYSPVSIGELSMREVAM